jgi:hypothetical protein
VRHVRRQQAIHTLHPLPVIFIRSSTNETDLIVLAVATESWPSKPMGAQVYEESLQKCHDCPSLRHGPELGGGIVLKRRVNPCDHYAGALSNYGSAFRVQVTAYLTGYCSLAYSVLASFRMGMSGSASFYRIAGLDRQNISSASSPRVAAWRGGRELGEASCHPQCKPS